MKTIASLLVLSLTSSAALAEEWTQSHQIATLRVSGFEDVKTVYFEAAANSWGVAGCPAAKFVYVRDNIALNEILAVGLAAKMGGSIVRFTGECRPDGNYFLANYIYLQ